MKQPSVGAGTRLRRSALSAAVTQTLRDMSEASHSACARRLKPAVLAASGGAILATALAVGPGNVAYAQAQEGTIEEITVTGSRIRRQDFVANSPVQTVSQEMFEETSAIGVETVLNRLPQFAPAVTQFTTTDVQQTATNTVGISTVSLRGLGPNRNLVLINGRRAMPVDPQMQVDTNSIPAAAIQRVEIISGGASAVYGADAVGGVVNFILKDDFEGATVDVRFGDTQHGGDQTLTVSALVGANAAGGRGNVMLGMTRDTRSKAHAYQRDWRVADFANPNTGGGFFAFGSATWFHNEWSNSIVRPNPNYVEGFVPPPPPPGQSNLAVNPAALPTAHVPNPDFDPNEAPSLSNPTTVPNLPSQAVVDGIFSALDPGTLSVNAFGAANNPRFRLNRDGTVFSCLNDGAQWAPGAYRFNGPLYNHPTNPQSGDLDGDLQGLPVFVQQPHGCIKENNLYSWTSFPLERLSGFASGKFDISDNMRVTAQAMVTRTNAQTQLGLSSANINQWGVGIPFGNELYRGNNDPHLDIPDSLIDNGDGTFRTHPDYTINGRFGVECDAAPTPEMPWLDGQPGCTKSEAFPMTAELYNIMISRVDPEQIVWLSREPDWLRSALGAGRSTSNVTTTMSFSLGLEGDLPSGNHFWDVSLYTGRTDNYTNQLGSIRLHSYRRLLEFPNFGKNPIYDSNPHDLGGFGEPVPTCATGLPIVHDFVPSQDCIDILAPGLKNEREMTQSIFEANLTGTIAEMPAGPLQYALGTAYRENSFHFAPDNLQMMGSITEEIAGLFPNEVSRGEFDVKEIYGELLIPLISNGPVGVHHFNIELGGRVSDWSMPQMPTLNTYKGLIDWAFTPNYRLRGGWNRAFRAPNLAELYSNRAQTFGAAGATRDWCSQNLNAPGTFSATPPGGVGTDPTAQTLQTLDLCRQLMGPGQFEYYENRDLGEQPTAGTLGIPNNFGNPMLREEQADTFTIGVVMSFLENVTMTVDWYSIDVKDMIAVEGGDSTYQRCLDMQFNPNGNINHPACQQIARNPSSGAGAFIDRSFTNQARVRSQGVDLQFTWGRPVGAGFVAVNSSANINLKEETQDTPALPKIDYAGYNSCSSALQCMRYDYRIFNTFNYRQGPWNVSLRHQHWPSLDNNACRTNRESNACINSSLPRYDLFALSGNYGFLDRYRVSAGIENLFDKAPPCTGADPNGPNFPIACTRTQGGGTYDPLGRRFFLSMTMEF
jgi:iron complex outermembrane recepter protein